MGELHSLLKCTRIHSSSISSISVGQFLYRHGEFDMQEVARGVPTLSQYNVLRTGFFLVCLQAPVQTPSSVCQICPLLFGELRSIVYYTSTLLLPDRNFVVLVHVCSALGPVTAVLGRDMELVSYPDPTVRNDDHRLQYDRHHVHDVIL